MQRPGRQRPISARRASLLASGALACLLLGPGAAAAQDLRGTSGAPRVPPPFDPSAVVTGVGVGQPIDPTAVYGTPSGGAPSGATSRRAPRRVARPVSGETRQATQGRLRPPQQAVTRLPDPPEPPQPRRRRSPAEEDPYAPLGIDLGGLTLRPAVTVSGGYDDNPDRAPNPGKGSWLTRTEGELGLKSDWQRHELSGELKGGYSRYFAAPDASRPDATGKMSLRLDILRDTTADFEARLGLDTQRPGSPELGAAVVGRPLIYSYGASAGLTQSFNRLAVSLRGSVDRTTYEDARLTNGSSFSQADRNLTQYGLRLRASYETTPGLRPFVEVGLDTRRFDREVDAAGFRRSSDGLTGRVGSSFELTRLVRGEVSIGHQTRRYDDPRLKELRGLIGDASLVWNATELTTVTLRGASSLNDTTIAGVNGATYRSAELKVAHALRRNLMLTGTVGWAETDYQGFPLREATTTLGAALDWKLTRSVAVRASFTHERLNSTAQGADYTANVYLLGLRLQI